MAESHLISSSSDGAQRMNAFLAVTILSECSTCFEDDLSPPRAPPRLDEAGIDFAGVPVEVDGSEDRWEEGSFEAGSYSSASRIRERGMILWGFVSCRTDRDLRVSIGGSWRGDAGRERYEQGLTM